ncbi:hypothetical protein OfM1_19180 [Lactovum odontotermitis]
MNRDIELKIKEFVDKESASFSDFADEILGEVSSTEDLGWEVILKSFEEEKGSLKQDLMGKLGFEISRKNGAKFDY